ncbi:MAG: phosphoribosyltransferase [Methanotrichaceae archaeon]
MNLESFRCDLVSWDQSYNLAKALSKKIKSSGYQPDLVIAIGRGGYVPARVVCDFMLHNHLTSMKVEHWGIAAQKMDQAVVRFPLAIDVNGLKVLIVDDVTDTGDTLKIAVNYVKSLGAEEIKTGVLQHKTTSHFQPDYYGEKVSDWKWIIYPWAAHEDLVGFTERILSEKKISAEEIKSELKRRYQIEVDQSQIEEICEFHCKED